MKKNKFAILAIAIVSIFFFSACTNEDDFQNETINLSKKKETSNISTELIAADLINAINLNPEIAFEINSAISQIVDYGLDENLTFYDILNTSNSVFFHTDQEFLSLKQSINEKTLSDLGLYNPSNYYFNLNIYWGYHDSWDKNTLPIICYLTGNDNNTLNGFKIVNREIVNVTVTEEEFDSETQPIIIINFNENNYSAYPDFKNGIRTKGNVTWLKPIPEPIPEEPINEWNNPDKIYNAVFRSLTSGGVQHDTWIRGGSDFRVVAAYQLSNTLGSYAKHTCDFTRKEIKNKATKYYNYNILHPDWRPEFEDIEFRLMEHDGGSSSSFTVKLSVKDYVSIDITIPKFSWDDEIGKTPITRGLYFANYIANTTIYGMGDCSISAGLRILDRPY
ncbi:MAG: hypothetical protein RBT05_12170 [Bacteroidales bacterium]|jgi:hypothetical protein|nr:hypothetical protein [Bacteroidales bacterium]